jgi:hypothetical protein
MASYTPLVAAFDKLKEQPRKRAMLVAIANLLPDLTEKQVDAVLAFAELEAQVTRPRNPNV